MKGACFREKMLKKTQGGVFFFSKVKIPKRREKRLPQEELKGNQKVQISRRRKEVREKAKKSHYS